jgi:hypothetical protein
MNGAANKQPAIEQVSAMQMNKQGTSGFARNPNHMQKKTVLKCTGNLDHSTAAPIVLSGSASLTPENNDEIVNRKSISHPTGENSRLQQIPGQASCPSAGPGFIISFLREE